MRVLIIPDKFKGTLTAREAGDAMAEGWRSVRPEDEIEVLPMSDGGDGFGPIIGGMMGLTERKVETVDSANRPHVASFWADKNVAVIEAAQVNGLALLPPGKFHPFELDTFGLGKVYRAAAAMGVKKIIVGIGGSSTNDGGFGFARGLGWKFLDREGKGILRWTDLESLETLKFPEKGIFIETIVGVDVQNPLLGENGASQIYGPQKGLRPEDMEKAEACLRQLADTVQKLNQQERRQLVMKWKGRDWGPITKQDWHDCGNFADLPGAGAAGGLGFGLVAFLGARFQSGAEIFAQASRLDERLKSADLVISGEGAMDAQSLMGKGVGELFERCRKAGVKRIGIAGSLGKGIEGALAKDRELQLFGIVPFLTTLDDAKARPAQWVRALAAEAARKWNAR